MKSKTPNNAQNNESFLFVDPIQLKYPTLRIHKHAIPFFEYPRNALGLTNYDWTL
jgi:hypothetical protein